MTEQQVRVICEDMIAQHRAAGGLGGPVDDFVMAKLRAAVQTVTTPERITQAIIASGLPMSSVSAMDLAAGLSDYLRGILNPLVQ